MKFRVLNSLLFIFFVLNCTKDEPPLPSHRLITVKTVPVKYQNMALPVRTSGVLSAAENIKLSFKIGGIIDRIFVGEGESVIKGQTLASLDLTEIKARAQQAREALSKAERDLARAGRLFAEGAVTREQFQNAETARKLATSELAIAEFNLSHAVIKAPENGTILKRFAEEKEMIAPGYPVFVFASQSDSWIIRCGISDRQIVQLSLGDSALVRFGAWPGKSFVAVVSELAGNVDPASGTFEVELALGRTDVKLVSGFVARVDIAPSAKKAVRLVPVEALVEADGDNAFIFTAEHGRARKLPLRIGPIINEEVIVLSGLDSTSQVITLGAPYLREGVEIKVAAPEK